MNANIYLYFKKKIKPFLFSKVCIRGDALNTHSMSSSNFELQFQTHTSEAFQYSAPLGSSAISHRSLLSCFSSYNMPAWHFVYLFCGVASFNCKYFRTNEVEAQYSDPLIHLKLLYLFEDLDIVHSFYFSPHVFIFLFSYSFCVHFPQKGTFGGGGNSVLPTRLL